MMNLFKFTTGFRRGKISDPDVDVSARVGLPPLGPIVEVRVLKQRLHVLVSSDPPTEVIVHHGHLVPLRREVHCRRPAEISVTTKNQNSHQVARVRWGEKQEEERAGKSRTLQCASKPSIVTENWAQRSVADPQGDPMKRAIDIGISASAIVLLAPAMLLLAILVKTTSPGPVLFRQFRMGRGGRPFRLLKFRSMRDDAAAENGRFDLGSPARVTNLGRWLRRSKLDETPQLLNVLRGDMSIVGPRPEVEKWTTVYPERWARVLSVRPGITDRGSIEFRDEESILAASDDPSSAYANDILPRKLDLAEQYVDDHTIFGDFKIMLDTLLTVLFPRRSSHRSKTKRP